MEDESSFLQIVSFRVWVLASNNCSTENCKRELTMTGNILNKILRYFGNMGGNKVHCSLGGERGGGGDIIISLSVQTFIFYSKYTIC